MKHLGLLLILLVLVGCAPVDAVQPSAAEQAQLTEAGPVEGQSQAVVEVAPPIQTGEGRTVEIIGGDEEALREFVQRWLAPVYPGASGGVTRVWLGRLPESMPVEVPVPEGARIIASVQEPEGFNQIVFDVELTSGEVTEFYTQTLTAAGWQPAPQDTQGGFVGPGDFPSRFCRENGDGYLEVWSLDPAEGPTDVRLNLYMSAASCFYQERGPGSMDEGMSLIPSLEAPAGTQMLGGGSGSSGDGSAYISTDLESSLTAEALLEHYNAQLAAAGWKLVDQGVTPVVAWSTWKLADEDGHEWGGTLIVMEGHLRPDRRFAMLSVEKAPQ
jgi:hypothetical protein